MLDGAWKDTEEYHDEKCNFCSYKSALEEHILEALPAGITIGSGK